MSGNLDFYPRLVVRGADAACEFYVRAFGGAVTERHTTPDGAVVHAMVESGPVRIAVKDADTYDPAPTPGGPLPVILAVYVDDPDGVAERMVAGGAEVLFPVTDHDYGDRGGRLRDPFGHLWMVARRL